MSFKQRNRNLILLSVVIIVATFKSFSIPADTSLKDVTGVYKYTLPSSSGEMDLMVFQVAIIPLDSIGMYINWDELVSPFDASLRAHSTIDYTSDKEFENALLKCCQSNDSARLTTNKMKKYCRKIFESDPDMQGRHEVNYVSFTKSQHLIIAAFVILWRATYKCADETKCKEMEQNKGKRIDAYIDKMVQKMSFYPIPKTNKK